MIIIKFGGTSVSTKERIQTICEIVAREKDKEPIVVVSAIRGVTDLLLSLQSFSKTKQNKILREIAAIHEQLAASCFGNLPLEIEQFISQSLQKIEKALRKSSTLAQQDEIVSYGEILSSYIISFALREAGILSEQVTATELIVTDDNFANAEFVPGLTTKQTKRALFPLIRKGVVPVVTGFIGSTLQGKTTTLGRGGSDYTAAILGFALNATEIQIWTDVDGIYTADPRSVPTAAQLKRVTYKEASELAAFGAKILHPRTIKPAIKSGISVRVLNTLNPTNIGTQISGLSSANKSIVAVACKRKVTLINLYSIDMLLSRGFLVRIFEIFMTHNISVDLVSVSEVSVSVTLDNTENLDMVIEKLAKFTAVTKKDVGVVSLIGEKVSSVPHIMKDIFSLLDVAKIPVHMISFGASEINISIVLDCDNVDLAVRVLHDSLIVGNSYEQRSYL